MTTTSDRSRSASRSPGRRDSERRDALEEQRDFLLRSIDDLEREYAAGDLDEADYLELKDDYTARAADVLRRLKGSATGRRGGSRRRRPGVVAAWVVGIVVFGLLAGFLVAQASGRRGANDVGSGDIRSNTRSLLAEADEAFQAGEIDAAVEAYDGVLELEPSNTEALAYRGWLVFGQGEVDEGISQIQEALEVDDGFVDAWSFLVLALDREGRTDEALAEIGELVAGGGSDVAVVTAQQLSGSDQAVLAVQVYDAVLAVDPENAPALTYRGWLLHQAQLDDEAITYLDRAVAADPGVPDALVFRAVVLRDLGRDDEARESLAAFDALDPPEQMRQLVDQLGLRESLAP